MITINPQAADVITINISDADQIQLNTTAIVLLEGGGSSGGDADTLQGENGAYYLSRANHTGSQAIGTVTGLDDALSDLADADSTLAGEIVAINNVLPLKADLVGGVIPSSQIPAIAITELLTLAGNVLPSSEAEMLTLRGQSGDFTIRTDESTTYVIVSGDGSVIGNWIALPQAASPVLSVNGQTGAVTLGRADVGINSSDDVPEGSSKLYFTGQRVRDTPLTGLSTATATPITATDTVLSAAGKLQGQASANATAIAAKLNTADAPATVRATALTGLSLATATPITAADSVLSAAGKLQAQISAISGGGMYIAGRYYSQAMNGAPPPAAASRADGAVFFMPFLPHSDLSISRFGFSPAGVAAGARLKAAIYEAVGANLVRVTDSLDIDAAAGIRLFFNQSFGFKAERLYFFGFKTSVSRLLSTVAQNATVSLGSVTGDLVANNLQVTFLSQAGVTYAPDMPSSVDSSILTESSTAPTAIAFQVTV